MQVSGCLPCIPRRYMICFLCFLAMMLTYILRFCLSIAITEMVRSHHRNVTFSQDCPRDLEYVEEPTESGLGRGEFSWDEETQGLILSSFFWGYVVSQVPGGMMAERLGGKWPLAFSLLVSSLCSLLTPWAARSGGPWGLVALRVTMGLGQGFTYPSLCALVARWAPIEERGRLGTLVFAGANFGNVVSMSLSGELLSLTGGAWSSLFLLYGCAGLVWLWCWVWLGFSRPEEHPALTVRERQQLQEYAASVNMRQVLPSTPWKAMFTSTPLWGLIVAQIGHDWGLFTIITDLPKYMKSVLHFSIAQTGIRVALPYVAMCVVAILAGTLVDFLLTKKITSITTSRKIFTTVASVGPAVGIISASYAGCDKTAVTLCLVAGMGLMGFFYPSLKVNALDLSPNYAGTTMALVNGIGACSGIITPYLVGVIIPDNTMDQWRHVFLIAAAVLVLTNIVFVLAGSGETQPWNDPPAADKPHKTVIRTLSLPWNPKQSWRIEPAPYRSPSMFIR